MNFNDEFRYLVSGYFGIREMDEYDLKIYVLKDIEKLIKSFVEENKKDDFNYQEEVDNIEKNTSLRTKLQDSLLVLNRLNKPNLELMLMINKRLKEMGNEYE